MLSNFKDIKRCGSFKRLNYEEKIQQKTISPIEC